MNRLLLILIYQAKLIIPALVMVCAFLILPLSISAAETASFNPPANRAMDTLANTAVGAGIINSANSAPTTYVIVGKIISIVLSFLGVVFLVLIIYAGIIWLTAQGNPENIKKATGIMTQAAIGLAIVLGAYLITNFVIAQIITTINTPASATALPQTQCNQTNFPQNCLAPCGGDVVGCDNNGMCQCGGGLNP